MAVPFSKCPVGPTVKSVGEIGNICMTSVNTSVYLPWKGQPHVVAHMSQEKSEWIQQASRHLQDNDWGVPFDGPLPSCAHPMNLTRGGGPQ